MRKKIQEKTPMFLARANGKDGVDIYIYGKECQNFTEFGFRTFSVQYLSDSHVTMTKRQLHMDLK